MTPLRAGEARVGVPLPGLVSDDAEPVLCDSARVNIAAGRVSIALSVRATGDAPALLLDGPLFGWSGASDPYPDRQFPELEIRLDGAVTTPENSFLAFAGKTNVTNMLRSAAVDPWAITRTPPAIESLPANAQVVKGLKSFGAIESSDDSTLAKWTAQRRVRIPLKNAAGQNVELNYRARPSESMLTAEQLDTTSREKTYCISPASSSRLPHSRSAGSLFVVTEYDVATGIDGKPPALVTFSWSHAAVDPVDYVFFCGPHGKPVARKGSVRGEAAEVDEAGFLHVMTVAAR
jgi:hypothetical protein